MKAKSVPVTVGGLRIWVMGRYYKALLLLALAVSKGQRVDHSGSNDSHHTGRLAAIKLLKNVNNSNENLVKYVSGL